MAARLVPELVTRIEAEGPIPFDELVEAALYDPADGFYEAAGGAGRRRDFLTSPEVGPLFGAVVARALDAWWEALGSPARLRVVEAGAGRGTLARALRAAGPRCGDALELVLVERSAAQRAAHVPLLAEGLVAASRPDLPEPAGPTIVLANELLDNLPFRLVERTADGWAEVRVGVRDGTLVEVLRLTPGVEAFDALAPSAPVGARVPWPERAAQWVDEARRVAGPGGRVVVLDYGAATAELAERPQGGVVRTYRRHGPGGAPLEDLGGQDITTEVAVDQLPPATVDLAQADWLRAHGIEDLLEEGRAIWRERAHLGDLVAVRARSRLQEAEALLDPTGLGGFRVLEWAVP